MHLYTLDLCTYLPSIVFGLIDDGVLAPSIIRLVEGEERNLTVDYFKGRPDDFSLTILARGGGGNASKLP